MPSKGFLKKLKTTAEESQSRRVEEKSLSSQSHDDSNWLISYADMMTLLCGFFIMLFSMSKLDAPQYDGFKEALAKQFGGEYRVPSRETARFITQVLEEAGLAKEALVRSDYTGVAITFSSTVFFDTLSSEVTPRGKEILKKLIENVSRREEVENKKYKIVVEGHSDSRPILSGPYASNWELSAARSARVVRLFLENHYQSENLTAIAYADTHPVAAARKPSGDFDETALAKNRRVVIRILEPKVDAIPFPESPPETELKSQIDAKNLTPPPPASPSH